MILWEAGSRKDHSRFYKFGVLTQQDLELYGTGNSVLLTFKFLSLWFLQ